MVTLIHIFNYPESSDSSVSKCGRRNRFSPDGRCSCLSLNLRYIIDAGTAASMLYISTAVAEWFKAVDLSCSMTISTGAIRASSNLVRSTIFFYSSSDISSPQHVPSFVLLLFLFEDSIPSQHPSCKSIAVVVVPIVSFIQLLAKTQVQTNQADSCRMHTDVQQNITKS